MNIPKSPVRRPLSVMVWLALLGALFLAGSAAQAERIKDIATLSGVRTNQLVGYGLVVGLDGTGDMTTQAPFTIQSLESMLAQFGIVVPAAVSSQMTLKNVAAVAVNAELPAFAKPGQNLDVTVSSLGNATSLRGGTLLMTPLRGANGEVYAMAQGSLVVGGFGASGSDGSKITVNIPSAGLIPSGATVERLAPSSVGSADLLVWNLHDPDFTTAKRLADAINDAIGAGTARPLDATSIAVQAPRDMGQRVSYVSVLENLTLEPGEAPAKVIINSRTGTVVIGEHVRVTAAAVAHGNLTVTITERPTASQPAPLSGGTTVVVPASDVKVSQEAHRMFLFKAGVSLDQIVRAVNQVGAAPGDLVAILEALRQAGALRAELIVI